MRVFPDLFLKFLRFSNSVSIPRHGAMIRGEGSIVNALSGGDVKQAIYLHKLMFEAILCMEIKH